MLDIAIRDGKVIDGTGNPWFRADVGIIGEKIVSIGRIEAGQAQREIDAKGLMVCSGFIDVHSHTDLIFSLDAKDQCRYLEGRIRQGITTEIIGNCGKSVGPINQGNINLLKGTYWMSPEGSKWDWSTLGDYLKALESQGVALNVGTLVGHGTVRIAVMGMSAAIPDQEQLAKMKTYVREALEDGAFGLSCGLIYPPGMYATTHELIRLAEAAAQKGRIFTSHIRGSSETLLPAVKEIIKIGQEAGVSIQHSHHEAVGKDHWWKIGETLKLEEAARGRGVSISYDVFPYVAANTSMTAIFPPWSLEGGIPKLLERLRIPEVRGRIELDIESIIPGWPPWIPGCWAHNIAEAVGWDNIHVYHVGSEKNRRLMGKSIEEVSVIVRKKPFDAVADLMLEENGIVSCFVFGVSGDLSTDEPNKTLIKHPLGAISTDAVDFGKGNPHPAAYGTYPRVIGRYARDEKIITVEEAVRKMTSWPAQIMGIRDRGLIREGMYGDIVLFDFGRVKDKATYTDARQFPDGIEYVLINGKIVIERGEYHRSLPGMVLRR